MDVLKDRFNAVSLGCAFLCAAFSFIFVFFGLRDNRQYESNFLRDRQFTVSQEYVYDEETTLSPDDKVSITAITSEDDVYFANVAITDEESGEITATLDHVPLTVFSEERNLIIYYEYSEHLDEHIELQKSSNQGAIRIALFQALAVFTISESLNLLLGNRKWAVALAIILTLLLGCVILYTFVFI